MLSEKGFLKVYEINPISFPRSFKPNKTLRAVAVICTVMLFVVITKLDIEGFEITGARDVLKKAVKLNAAFSMPVHLFYFVSSGYNNVLYSNLRKIDSDYDLHVENNATFFFFIFILMVQVLIAAIKCLTSHKARLFLFNQMGNYNLLKLTALKEMVRKRLVASVERASALESLLKSMPALRRILDYNRALGRAYSLQAAVHIIGGLQELLFSATGFWEAYGLKVPRSNYEKRHPIWAHIIQHQVACVLISLGYVNAKIDHTIESWIWEIDREISVGHFSLEHREKLECLILEIEVTPTKFSSLNLFFVDNSTIVSVFGFIVNIMMIIIQFFK